MIKSEPRTRSEPKIMKEETKLQKQKLNRNIKYLFKRWKETIGTDGWYSQENILKNELKKLWDEDLKKNKTNYANFKRLLIMNQSMRVISLYRIATYLSEK